MKPRLHVYPTRVTYWVTMDDAPTDVVAKVRWADLASELMNEYLDVISARATDHPGVVIELESFAGDPTPTLEKIVRPYFEEATR